MPEKRVWVSEDNLASFVCPKCETLKVVDVGRVKGLEKANRVKCNCPCGHVYTVVLERRRFYRKEAELQGIFQSKDGTAKGNMVVVDISRSGIGCRLNDAFDLKIGDRIIVKFFSDQSKKESVQREAVIRKINNDFVGAEFDSLADTDNGEPYLLYL